MSDERDADRGRLAQAVLDNPVYAESYDLILQGITQKWQESRDRDEREQLHQAQRMLGLIHNLLETTMRTGKLASAELERKRSLADRVRDGLTSRRA